MTYTIKLLIRRFVSDNRDFGVFKAREKSYDLNTGGWATVVFTGTVPTAMSYFYDVTGTWLEHDTHGWQFIVSEWEIAAPTPRKTHDWLDMPHHQAREKPTGKHAAPFNDSLDGVL